MNTNLLNLSDSKDNDNQRIFIEEKIKNCVKKFYELKLQLKELERLVDEYKDRIKCYMIESNLRNCEIDDYVITYSKITQMRFDAKEFEKEHKDLYDKYKKEISVEKLDVKKK